MAPLFTPGNPISSSRRSPRSTRGATSDSYGEHDVQGCRARCQLPLRHGRTWPGCSPRRSGRNHDVALPAGGRSARHGWPTRWAAARPAGRRRWPHSITAWPTPFTPRPHPRPGRGAALPSQRHAQRHACTGSVPSPAGTRTPAARCTRSSPATRARDSAAGREQPEPATRCSGSLRRLPRDARPEGTVLWCSSRCSQDSRMR